MGTVVISTSDYIKFANQHLLDRSTYCLFPSLPTERLLACWKLLRTILLQHGKLHKFRTGTHLSDIARYILQLEPTDPSNPKLSVGQFYLLMKVHKKELAGRPIISCINTMTYYASKYIDRIVQPLMKQLSSYITSSHHLLFELEVKKHRFPPDCWILCADIDSLYPNIPTKEGVLFFKSALLRYNNNDQFFPTKDIDFICNLLRWVLENNYFSFGDQYYHQINGTAMGTPVAVVYACLVLDEVEFKAFQTLDFRPLFFKRFIDDILSINSTRDQCERLLSAICSILTTIKSTSFTISDQHGVFLDIELYKGSEFISSGIFSFKLYQKPQNKYLYLSPLSHHSPHVFTAWITSEVNRYCLLNSEHSDFVSICMSFKQRLMDRGYKEPFIEEQFRKGSTRNVLLNHLVEHFSKSDQHSSSLNTTNRPPIVFKTKYNTLVKYLKLHDCLQVPNYLSQHQVFSSIFDRNHPIICFSNHRNLRSLLCKARKTLHTHNSSYPPNDDSQTSSSSL